MSKTRLLASLLLTVCSTALHAGPGTSNPYGGKRVLIIGIDGCRADALKQQVENSNAPHIASLIANGTVTWNAYTGGDLGTATQQVTLSGPGWSSILTGTWINRHNVNSNNTPAYDQPTVAGSYLVSQAPHFAKYLKQAQPSTYVASIVNWSWIDSYLIAAQPSWFDLHSTVSATDDAVRDTQVATAAASLMATANPDVVFLHFDQIDHAGHGTGFSASNPDYLTAIANVDTCIGTVLTALNSRPQIASENWLIILTTDHGGNSGHGGQTTEERTIPFIVSGGGVPVGVSTASPGLVAVAPTAMRFLGIGIPASWQFAQNAFVTGPTFIAANNSGNVQLTWTLPAAGIPGATGFEIFRNGTSLGSFPLTQTTFTDTTAPLGPSTYHLSFTGTSEAQLSASTYVTTTGQIAWDDANSNNNWNTTDLNWSGGSLFANGLQALFASTGEIVSVNTAGVAPSDTSIIGNGAYTFTGGAISGTLTKGGSGTLTLNSANNFSSTSINAGNILLGNALALGNGPIAVAAAASTDTTGGATIATTSISTNAVMANAITLPADTVASTRALYMYGSGNGTNTLEFSGKISGGSSFTTLYLNNNQGGAFNPQFIFSNNTNDFRANILINRGGLQITSDAALGNAANTITFNSNSGADLTFINAMTYSRATALSTATDFDTKNNNITASGVISGGSALTKLGSGTLTLTAANTYSGATTIAAGVLQLSSTGTLGNGNYVGAISLNSATTLNHNSSTTQTLSGIISGAGQITKSGSSALTLNGANTYSGGTTISNGPNTQSSAAIIVGNNTALGTNAVTLNNTASFTAFYNGSTSRTLANNITLSSTAALTTRMLAGNATTFEFDGIISGGTASSTLLVDTNLSGGSTGLIKLTGANTFLGKIQLNRGGLAITSDAALGNSANTILFDIGTSTQVGLRFDAALSSARNIQLGSSKQVFDTAGNNVSLTGIISGTSGQLFKAGAGTLTLSNTNTYGGLTTVDAGTLLVNGALNTSTNGVNATATGTLGGSGTINRPVTITGNLSPGNNAAGTLTIGSSLTLAASSTMTVQIQDWTGVAGTGFDSVAANTLAINATAASKLTIHVNCTGITHFADVGKVFTIVTAGAAPTGLAADNWTINPVNFTGNGTWALQTSGNSLQLVYTPNASAFVSWATSKGLAGNDASFTADPDGDGLANGIEFVLGTEPNPANPDSANGVRPSVSFTGNALLFTYQCADMAASYQTSVEFSNNLIGQWTTAVNSENASINRTDGSPTDTVSVSIPVGTNTRLFARLKVVGME